MIGRVIKMEKLLEQTLLYDFYGELLTEHQKKIYENVIFNDLSLSEAAADAGISRQGVHDLLKRCTRILSGYEEKLHLIERFLRTRRLTAEIGQLIRAYRKQPEEALLTRIEQICEEIQE